MYPNYIGQALQQLSGDVRNFAEMPSQNAYRQSMAELESAKFEAEKPMLEMQAGEAREMLRPTTVADVIPQNAPEHIKALFVANNNIEGQPSIIDRIFSTTGVTRGDNDVLMRDGKPVPYYAWNSPRYQQKVSGVLRSAIKPDKYLDFEVAYLKPKIDAGEATPEEIAKYNKYANMTPEQKKSALMKHGQELGFLYRSALERGDKAEADSVWRDAEYNRSRIEGIDNILSEQRGFDRQKELILFEYQMRGGKEISKSDLGKLISERDALAAENPNSPHLKAYDALINASDTTTGKAGTYGKAARDLAGAYGIPIGQAMDMYRSDQQIREAMDLAGTTIDARKLDFMRMTPDEKDVELKNIYNSVGLSSDRFKQISPNTGLQGDPDKKNKTTLSQELDSLLEEAGIKNQAE